MLTSSQQTSHLAIEAIIPGCSTRWKPSGAFCKDVTQFAQQYQALRGAILLAGNFNQTMDINSAMDTAAQKQDKLMDSEHYITSKTPAIYL